MHACMYVCISIYLSTSSTLAGGELYFLHMWLLNFMSRSRRRYDKPALSLFRLQGDLAGCQSRYAPGWSFARFAEPRFFAME